MSSSSSEKSGTSAARPGIELGGRIEEIVQPRGSGPALEWVGDDGWDDDRQWPAVGLLVALQDADEVDEHAKRHVVVVGALVFEQEVEQNRGAAGVVAQPHGEQQVGVAVAEVGVDERAGLGDDGVPVDGGDDGGR